MIRYFFVVFNSLVKFLIQNETTEL